MSFLMQSRILNSYSNVKFRVQCFASNKIAVNTAAELAVDLGYLPYVLSTRLDGEARETGRLFTK